MRNFFVAVLVSAFFWQPCTLFAANGFPVADDANQPTFSADPMSVAQIGNHSNWPIGTFWVDYDIEWYNSSGNHNCNSWDVTLEVKWYWKPTGGSYSARGTDQYRWDNYTSSTGVVTLSCIESHTETYNEFNYDSQIGFIKGEWKVTASSDCETYEYEVDSGTKVWEVRTEENSM